MPTTVLVDAWHLAGYSANRGIGTYLRNVLPRLAAQPDLEVFGLAVPSSGLPHGVRPRRIRRFAPDRFAQREHDLRLPADLAWITRRVRADVFLSPADNPPLWCPIPWVQMLHDLIPLAVPDQRFSVAARRWRRLGPRLRKARAVVTDSHATAIDAKGLLGIDDRRLKVAHLGVSGEFEPRADLHRPAGRRILYVGEYGPHKGFREAFDVVSGLAENGLPHRLEMVGFLAPWYEPAVQSLLASAARPDRVELSGYVDDLVGAYQQADALIVTSRYEGFCLPALEAMACGTPVVAFANSAIVEVVGDGGVLVPDGDVPAMVVKLVELLTDEAAWASVSVRGLAHARRFSWDDCARAIASVLRAAAA